MTEFVSKLLRRWDSTANDLLPAYFAMVMATGIVAIAAHIYGMNYFSQFLFYVDLIGYAVLWALSLYRMAVHGKRYLADLTDHARGPGFFTVIAGNNTLGSVFLLVERNYTIAFGLWIFGFILWVFYQYFIFSALSLDKNKPTLEKGINGAWLVAIVSTQSVSVLAAQLSPLHHWMYLVALVMYMIGWMTYILVMSLINYRLLFMKLDSSDITGPYWINMGATAITTLAGSLLLIEGQSSNFVEFSIIRPYLIGATVMIWAYGSWWIPWLFIVGVWKYTRGHDSILRYDPFFWSGVFPMGMYTVSTYMMAKATTFTQFKVISDYFVYIAIVAWVYEFIGLVVRIFTGRSRDNVPMKYKTTME